MRLYVTLDFTINTVNVVVNDNGVTITADASGVNYKWVDCNNNFDPIPGEVGQSFTPLVNGSYAVIITVPTIACTKMSTCVVFNTVGVKESLNSDHLFSLFPNPNNGNFTVKATKVLDVVIYNAAGQIILSQKIKPGQNQVNLENYNTGIYLFSATDETGNRFNKRVVITK